MKKLYSAIKYILLLSVAAILLWASFRGVHWNDFKEGLRSANFHWIGASMLASVAAFWFRAMRWRLVMMPLGYKIGKSDAWDGINIGYITNFAVPRAGEFARCGVITKKTGLPFETVAGTVVLERSVDLLSLALVTISVLFFQWDKFGAFVNREILQAVGKSMSVNFAWIAFAVLFAAGVFLYIVYHFRKTNPIFRKMADIAKGVINGVVSGFRMPQKWMFLLYTVAIWFCYWLMSYTTILAFPAVNGLGASDALFLMMIGGFGWVIPVQGGIGAYHFIISLALASIYGIDQTTGVVFATISHESQAITMLLFGTLSLISFYFKKGTVK
ncbi:MAG: lysylphosphatidylglycerol synthase transmembrane domain-containing protein [Bacteroidales bacterium]|jgi:uncharacterized membrane protein YbhN (UPF0104 family)|nr:lysylphosphatidylglycerol synthase transmembrane domain-containing protein [Bacteroidales bacterium]MDD3300234.1 lysylphosphatidylglycerol synthase transmembrane domain-containing protein [Bacteroidales bacterium]MDD3844282.1 lysylphosphatidylglycerol synthase transmembrane domain-containing protein [Bacteroidales bacterium]MDD4618309.1 lysylphosphatidylglycerol synthase transmembrane domain-containing protein [Bacteroidales bacterium]